VQFRAIVLAVDEAADAWPHGRNEWFTAGRLTAAFEWPTKGHANISKPRFMIARRTGRTRFMAKPWTLDQLYEVVAKQLPAANAE
jgi:hypothetical protein